MPMWTAAICDWAEGLCRIEHRSTRVVEDHPVTREDAEVVELTARAKCDAGEEVDEYIGDQEIRAASDPDRTTAKDRLPEVRLLDVLGEALGY